MSIRSSMTPKNRVADENRCLIGWVLQTAACPSEMADVDAARKGMNVAVLLPLRFIEGLAACQHEVGAIHQLHFALLQDRRRSFERREFIHTVIHGRHRRQMVGERQCHRGVVPQQIVRDGMGVEQSVEQCAQRHTGRIRRQVGRQLGHDDRDGTGRFATEVWRQLRSEFRFFDETYAPLASAACHQLLRSLKHEIPPEMRQADDIGVETVGPRGHSRRWSKKRAVAARRMRPDLASIFRGTSSGRIVKESDARVVEPRLVSDDLGGQAVAEEPSLDQPGALAWCEPLETAERLNLEVWTST
jgi:hypothetical protein